ncbi:helix-turn-helix domain-containing protein [Herbaspirillum huttiense]|uniref:Helix-turn-helix transcriptional regulator n=2 Tax=Herbaspirillum huttiense TaxID=863372 RepID=A0AAJ2HCZ2_9BURK|nr:helix-turn-helix transcriptional regulator [Herbaspirillum huttiense]MDR9837374.1 helix-turn-helix transcriptional regulator [Herbaspirillum huttiense]MDR9837790.1 helix-turn-helix transcriptional regulator [Herbaspirillum huttiense]
MTYSELIEKATKGRSSNSLAKLWGVPQKTLYNYLNGKSMPDYCTALRIAHEANVDDGEVLRIIAREELKLKGEKHNMDGLAHKLSPSFNALLRMASACWTKIQRVAQ